MDSECAMIDIHEHYIKQTCRNRCQIYSANGILPLIVPVIKIFGNHTPVKDTEIYYNQNWFDNHWRAIESAYNASAYFLYFKDELYRILYRKYRFLIDLNQDLLEFISRALGITLPWIYSPEFIKLADGDMDFRSHTMLSGPFPGGFRPYPQVFASKFGFIPNLSILDLLVNMGPESVRYLNQG